MHAHHLFRTPYCPRIEKINAMGIVVSTRNVIESGARRLRVQLMAGLK